MLVIRSIALLLILVTSGCSGLGATVYHLHGVYYDSEKEWVAAIRANNAAMHAKIHRREKPGAGPARIFLPSHDHVYQYYSKVGFYPSCGGFICRSEDQKRREIKGDATASVENYLSTAQSIELSNIFQSVSIETYENFSDVPSSDPDHFTIVIQIKGPAAGWSLSTPGASAFEALPEFDQAIKPRERRMNEWLDVLEDKVKQGG